MTPAEVIAMRDKLAEWLRDVAEIVPGSESFAAADALIESGWVTSEPKENVLDCKRKEEDK